MINEDNMFWSKFYRTLRILGDRSEIFDERPEFRIEIILHIWFN